MDWGVSPFREMHPEKWTFDWFYKGVTVDKADNRFYRTKADVVNIWPRELLVEAILAHREYIVDKPWMEKPRPLVVDVHTLEAMISEIDALKAELNALKAI